MKEKSMRLPPVLSTQWSKYALLFMGLIVVAVFFVNGLGTKAPQLAEPSQGPSEIISEQTLEDQYGIRINLIAVTAAGGLVDFRMKILNAEKAKPFLEAQGKHPVLFVEESGITLQPPEDSNSERLELEDGSLVFDLFPNLQTAVKPGTPVTVIFGQIAVEPIPAK